MKTNEDCVRDILSYLVENLSIKIEDNKGGFKTKTLLSVMNKFSSSYSKEDIWYSVYGLSSEKYIETTNMKSNTEILFVNIIIYNVTYKGHLLYESIQPQKVWDKTKSIVTRIGNHTLNFIETVAHDVAVESAKEIVSNLTQPK